MMVLPAGTEISAGTIGNKALALLQLAGAGLPVPPFFCVSVQGMHSLAVAEIKLALAHLGADSVAVRSSAVDEDRPEASFAGMYATRLNVITAEEVQQALADISKSAFSPASLAYRKTRGISSPPQIAAAVQQLIRAEASGVLFTKDPIQDSDNIIIEGCWGLGETLAGGTVTPDRWILSKNGKVLSATIGDKDIAVVPAPGGSTKQVEIDEKQRRMPCLGRKSLQQLLKLALECERLFAGPQDIEWAVASNELWLLQSRPISRSASA